MDQYSLFVSNLLLRSTRLLNTFFLSPFIFILGSFAANFSKTCITSAAFAIAYFFWNLSTVILLILTYLVTFFLIDFKISRLFSSSLYCFSSFFMLAILSSQSIKSNKFCLRTNSSLLNELIGILAFLALEYWVITDWTPLLRSWPGPFRCLGFRGVRGLWSSAEEWCRSGRWGDWEFGCFGGLVNGCGEGACLLRWDGDRESILIKAII